MTPHPVTSNASQYLHPVYDVLSERGIMSPQSSSCSLYLTELNCGESRRWRVAEKCQTGNLPRRLMLVRHAYDIFGCIDLAFDHVACRLSYEFDYLDEILRSIPSLFHKKDCHTSIFP